MLPKTVNLVNVCSSPKMHAVHVLCIIKLTSITNISVVFKVSIESNVTIL